MTLDVPTSANGFLFRSKFYTTDFPSYICSAFNDVFAVIVTPMVGPLPDVALDSIGDPISVNSAFIEVCGCAGGPPCTAGGKVFTCALGTPQLAGTGFDAAGGAATAWLETQVPVAGGTRIHVRFAIWDSSDGLEDSTVLLDGFRWITNAPSSPVTTLAP